MRRFHQLTFVYNAAMPSLRDVTIQTSLIVTLHLRMPDDVTMYGLELFPIPLFSLNFYCLCFP